MKYDWCATGTGEAQRNPREAYATMSRDDSRNRPADDPVDLRMGRERALAVGQGTRPLVAHDRRHHQLLDCELSHGNWSSFGIPPILDKQRPLRAQSGPDGWNDPDMMEVGNLDTLAENRSHFAMWAMLSAPLIMGTGRARHDAEIHAIRPHPRLIAIDRDPLGIAGFRWIGAPGLEVWAKPLADGAWAIALLNRGDSSFACTDRMVALRAEGRSQRTSCRLRARDIRHRG